MQPTSRREVFQGRLIRVEVQSWPAGEREVVRHPGACAVVALTPEGDVLLVRQMREAVGEELLEIPAGILDVEGEDAATCAVRELLEETGHRAGALEALTSIFTSPGFADERIDIFLARDVRPVDEARLEDGVEVVRMPFEDAVVAARDGGIRDAKSCVGLLATAMLNRPPAAAEGAP